MNKSKFNSNIQKTTTVPEFSMNRNRNENYSNAAVPNTIRKNIFNDIKTLKNNKDSNNMPEFNSKASCQYFKSSFARSLSICQNDNESRSLDFGINFNNDHLEFMASETLQQLPSVNTETGNYIRSGNKCKINTTSAISCHADADNNDKKYINKNNVWTPLKKLNYKRRSLDLSDIGLTATHQKEYKNLLEDQSTVNLQKRNSTPINTQLSSNVETFMLQNQVDTLKWQLKQVESSRDMYRALMEEVVRFLERCHKNLETLQIGNEHTDNNQHNELTRSKSTHHVYQKDFSLEINNTISKFGATTSSTTANSFNPRIRSSTNSMDVEKNNLFLGENGKGSDVNFGKKNSNYLMYNNFRDFTWRRSPKKVMEMHQKTADEETEKLSQEAFRLLRTAQNLLNTQEPDLTQSKCFSETTSISSNSPAANPKTTLNAPEIKVLPTALPTTNPQCCLDFDSFCITLSRKMNTRDSRLSLRSVANSSDHSTSSSSKNETDEENNTLSLSVVNHKESVIEQESGFSSINSFQEIGLPLNSTMICQSSESNINEESLTSSVLNQSNSLQLDESVINNNLNQSCKINDTLKMSNDNDRRNCLTSPTYYRNFENNVHNKAVHTNFYRFSTISSNTDDGPTVLWV